MRFMAFDAETFYCSKSGYTLSKMTSEAYIRDPRFELIGFSVAQLGQQPQWFTGDIEYLRSVAQSIDWSDVFVVGHNLAGFDALILTEVLGVRPAYYGCTLQLARCLHGSKTPDGKNISNALSALAKLYQREIEQMLGRPLFKGDEVVRADGKRRLDFSAPDLAAYGRYCNDDTELAGALWRVLSPKFPKSELFLASTVAKMWAEPRLVLDTPLLEAMGVELAERKAALLSRVADMLGVGSTMSFDERMMHTQKLLRSDAKFAELLQQFGVEVPMKRSPKKRDADGKAMLVYAFAKTDVAMTDLLEYEDGETEEINLAVQALAAARLGTKSTIAESRVERFHGISVRGALPVPYSYGATLTHRLSGCLVADTKIHCYDPDIGQCVKRIVDVLPDDLVWDGQEFVQHGGVVFQGYREVIEHDGVQGTPCHPVFISEDTAVDLATAKSTGASIVACREPGDWLVAPDRN